MPDYTHFAGMAFGVGAAWIGIRDGNIVFRAAWRGARLRSYEAHP